MTLPHSLPDDSWAVDERSLTLFVDKREAGGYVTPVECVEVAAEPRFLNQLALLPDSVQPTFSI